MLRYSSMYLPGTRLGLLIPKYLALKGTYAVREPADAAVAPPLIMLVDLQSGKRVVPFPPTLITRDPDTKPSRLPPSLRLLNSDLSLSMTGRLRRRRPLGSFFLLFRPRRGGMTPMCL